MSTLTARDLEFLKESNAIEDILDIDYADPANARPDAGHVGALLDSQRKAQAKEPLTVDDLCAWQGLIAEEQLRFGHELPRKGVGVLRGPNCPLNVRVGTHVAPDFLQVPALVDALVRDVNPALAKAPPENVAVAALLGDYFQRFESIHPFVDGNGRTSRLFANYMATRVGFPIVVFRLAERAEYYAAHGSAMAMRCFMGGKLREATFDVHGTLFLRTAGKGATDRYKSDAGKQFLVHNHDLEAAIDRWRASGRAVLPMS